MSRIAFIGLGTMGLPMAGHLLANGHDVTGYDPNSDALRHLSDEGGHSANSIAEAVTNAEFVVSMLPTDPVVRSAYLEPDCILASCADGTVLMDCSTVSVELVQEIAAAATQRGIAMLDSPVSGGHAAALTGQLIFMVGGEAEVIERARPVLMSMGREVVGAGPSGSGQLAKICNNALLGVHIAAASESMALGRKLGLDLAVLRDIISKSSGGSWVMDNYCPVPGLVAHAPSSMDYAPGFATKLMAKDEGLFQKAALNAGVPAPVTSAARAVFQMATVNGFGDQDCSIVFKMIAEEIESSKDRA